MKMALPKNSPASIGATVKQPMMSDGIASGHQRHPDDGRALVRHVHVTVRIVTVGVFRVRGIVAVRHVPSCRGRRRRRVHVVLARERLVAEPLGPWNTRKYIRKL